MYIAKQSPRVCNHELFVKCQKLYSFIKFLKFELGLEYQALVQWLLYTN